MNYMASISIAFLIIAIICFFIAFCMVIADTVWDTIENRVAKKQKNDKI